MHVIAAGGAVLSTRRLRVQGTANPFCADFRPHGPEITRRAADVGTARSLSLS